jgi:hypothetical protein
MQKANPPEHLSLLKKGSVPVYLKPSGEEIQRYSLVVDTRKKKVF